MFFFFPFIRVSSAANYLSNDIPTRCTYDLYVTNGKRECRKHDRKLAHVKRGRLERFERQEKIKIYGSLILEIVTGSPGIASHTRDM